MAGPYHFFLALVVLAMVAVIVLSAPCSTDSRSAGSMTTVAVSCRPGGPTGDGGLATRACLCSPWRLAVGADGSLYVASADNGRIRKVDPEGIITTAAGGGSLAAEAADGGPATAAGLPRSCSVALGVDGSLYIAETENHRVRKVDPKDIITTVAGNGEWGYSGDGGPAANASLSYPHDVAADRDGSIYIADAHNQLIRKVDPAGIITTVAGNGKWGYAGDGGPAVQASLADPRGVAVGADGSIYIADTYNHRIRKVDPAGIITTVAGDGWRDEDGFGRYAGDGAPATEASLHCPHDVAVGTDGSLCIADTKNHRIRKVDAAGIITTVAGSGKKGYSRDEGVATKVSLNSPIGIAVGGDGSLYIADCHNDRIRKLDLAGIITTVAGSGPCVGGPVYSPTGLTRR